MGFAFLRFRRFVRGVSVNVAGKLGVVLTTSSFIIFVLLELARLAGILTNAYIGLVTYLLFPALFVVGLILIPLGWRKYQKTTGRTTRELLREQFAPQDAQASLLGSNVLWMVISLSAVNLLFLGVATSQMLKFMDEPRFCGTACHTVMSPEWTTYQDSPHARVKCVECHVGEGASALVDSKLNGIWQMISASFDLYARPIPTPVRQLRPARETCEKCHWPDRFYGRRMKTIVSYNEDSASTPKYTTLNLKVDAGRAGRRAGIHWHIAAENEVHYASLDDRREEMIEVRVRQPDGSFKRYRNSDLMPLDTTALEWRILDCVDCHNRATHIYENPNKAVADRLRRGVMNRSLPYLYREGVAAITRNYPHPEIARQGIADHMRGFYERHFPQALSADSAALDSAIAALRKIYSRNIHQAMNIRWSSYPNHIGHRDGGGCFRCHNAKLLDNTGDYISFDCTLCHSILADDADEPLKFLQPADTGGREYLLREYLRREFLNSYME